MSRLCDTSLMRLADQLHHYKQVLSNIHCDGFDGSAISWLLNQVVILGRQALFTGQCFKVEIY